MALSATIFKLELSVADIDRHYYADHTLTLARHPSETDLRMVARILAFARHAHEDLQFTKGLSTDEEPDLWQKHLHGDIALWVEFGQIEEKRLRKACHKSEQVAVYTYQARSASVWWPKLAPQVEKLNNLQLWHLPEAPLESLANEVSRTMQWQCTVQDGALLVNTESQSAEISPVAWR